MAFPMRESCSSQDGSNRTEGSSSLLPLSMYVHVNTINSILFCDVDDFNHTETQTASSIVHCPYYQPHSFESQYYPPPNQL